MWNLLLSLSTSKWSQNQNSFQIVKIILYPRALFAFMGQHWPKMLYAPTKYSKWFKLQWYEESLFEDKHLLYSRNVQYLYNAHGLPLFWDNSINKWWNLLQSTKKYLPTNHKIVTRVKKPNTNYCTFTIIIWLFRSVVYLWHLTCIPYEVMPIQFFDWLTTYISNSRVHIFITLVLIIMNKWKDANIC